jgi:hypothetical protein
MRRDVLRTKKYLLKGERNTKSIGGIVCPTENIEDRVKCSIPRYKTNIPDLCASSSGWLRKVIEWLWVKQRVSLPFREEESTVELTVRHVN